MAHTLLGVDLGAHSLKTCRLEAGFRKATLLGVTIEPAAPADAANASQDLIWRIGPQLRALKVAIAARRESVEEVAIALPGEHITFRTVDLPFSDPRKIESVLGYELESEVLAPIEELVIGYVVIGPHGADTRVLTAAAPRALVAAIVKVATELDLPLRLIGAAPLAFATVVPPWNPSQDPAVGPEPPSLVIDIGHEHTTLCVAHAGKPELARAVPRAGRHFTDAIAAAFHLDGEAAERAKLDSGFIGHPGMRAESPGQLKMDECMREAAKPLLRELRQTLAAYRAAWGEPIGRAFLTGGGARLVGLREHLAEALGLAIEPLPWPSRDGWAEVPADQADRVLVAAAIADSVAAGGPQVNFRKGEFAFRSDYSFVRGKVVSLAASVLVVLAFAALNAFASLRGLKREHETLSARLKKESMELFGKELLAGEVSDELKGGSGQKAGTQAPPIPTVTAFDLLDEISKRVPPGDKMKLDILELDIKPKKTFLKATAETAQQVDDLTDALSKIECFEDVQKGKLSSVTGPTPPVDPKAQPGDKPPAPPELKQFTLTITTTCP